MTSPSRPDRPSPSPFAASAHPPRPPRLRSVAPPPPLPPPSARLRPPPPPPSVQPLPLPPPSVPFAFSRLPSRPPLPFAKRPGAPPAPHPRNARPRPAIFSRPATGRRRGHAIPRPDARDRRAGPPKQHRAPQPFQPTRRRAPLQPPRTGEGDGCAEEASRGQEDEGHTRQSTGSDAEEHVERRDEGQSLVQPVGRPRHTRGEEVACSVGNGAAVGKVLMSGENESREEMRCEGPATPEMTAVRKLVEEREDEQPQPSVLQPSEEEVPCATGEGKCISEGEKNGNTKSREETRLEGPPLPEAPSDGRCIVDRDAGHSGFQEAAENGKRTEGVAGKEQAAKAGTRRGEFEIFAGGQGEGQRLSVPTDECELQRVVPADAECERVQLPSCTPQRAEGEMYKNRVRDSSNGSAEQGAADKDKVRNVVPVHDEPERVRMHSRLPKNAHHGTGEAAWMTAPDSRERLLAETSEKTDDTTEERSRSRALGHASQQANSGVGEKEKREGRNGAGEDIARMSNEPRRVSPVDEAGKRLQLPLHAQHQVHRSVGEGGMGAASHVAGMGEIVRGTLPITDSGEQGQVTVLESGKADDDMVTLAVSDKLLTARRVVADERSSLQTRCRLPESGDVTLLKGQDDAAPLLSPTTVPVTEIAIVTPIGLQTRPEQEREDVPSRAGASRPSERFTGDLQGTRTGSSGSNIVQIDDDGDVQKDEDDSRGTADDDRGTQTVTLQADEKLPCERSASDRGRLRTRNSTPVIIHIDDDAELERSGSDGHVTAVGNKARQKLHADSNETLQRQQRAGDFPGDAPENSTPVIICIEDDEVLQQNADDTDNMEPIVFEAQKLHMASGGILRDQRSTNDETTTPTGNRSADAIGINNGEKLAGERNAEGTHDGALENESVPSGAECWKPKPSQSSDSDGGLNTVTLALRDVQHEVPLSVATPQFPIVLKERLEEETITLQQPHISLERPALPHPPPPPAVFLNQVISKLQAESPVAGLGQDCKVKLTELASEPLSKQNGGHSRSAVQYPRRFKGPPLATAAAFRRWRSQNVASSNLEGRQPKLSSVCGGELVGVQCGSMLPPRRNVEVQHAQVAALRSREQDSLSDTCRHTVASYPQHIGSSTRPVVVHTCAPAKGDTEIPSFPSSRLGTGVRNTVTPNTVLPCHPIGGSVQPCTSKADLRLCNPLAMAPSSCNQGNANTWFVPDGTIASTQHGQASLPSEEIVTSPIDIPTVTSLPQRVQSDAHSQIVFHRNTEGSQEIASIDMPIGVRLAPNPTEPPCRPPTQARSALFCQGPRRRENFSEVHTLELLRVWREAVEDPNFPFNKRAAIPAQLVSHVAAAVNAVRVQTGDPPLNERQVYNKMWYYRRKYISTYGDVLVGGTTGCEAAQKFKYYNHMREIVEHTRARAEGERQADIDISWRSAQGFPASQTRRTDAELPEHVMLRQIGVEPPDELQPSAVMDTPGRESTLLDVRIHGPTETALCRHKRTRTDMDGELGTREGASVLDAAISRGAPLKRPRIAIRPKDSGGRYVALRVVNSQGSDVVERRQTYESAWARHLSCLGWRSRHWPGWRAAGAEERLRRMLPDWARANLVQK